MSLTDGASPGPEAAVEALSKFVVPNTLPGQEEVEALLARLVSPLGDPILEVAVGAWGVELVKPAVGAQIQDHLGWLGTVLNPDIEGQPVLTTLTTPDTLKGTLKVGESYAVKSYVHCLATGRQPISTVYEGRSSLTERKLLFNRDVSTSFARHPGEPGKQTFVDRTHEMLTTSVIGKALGMIRADEPVFDGDDLVYPYKNALGSGRREGWAVVSASPDIFIRVGTDAITAWLGNFPEDDQQHFQNHL